MGFQGSRLRVHRGRGWCRALDLLRLWVGGFAGRKDVVCESGRLHRAGKEQQQSLKPCSQSDVMIEAFTDPSSSHWSS